VLNVKVVVITFEFDSAVRSYIEETNFPWPLLVDTDRKLYNSYGMLSAGFWDIWGPKTWWAYLKEICKGHFPRKSSGDLNQRGGDVLIDPSGVVRFHHIGMGPADRPDVGNILKKLKIAESSC
jgi:hypothetical protein